MAKRVSVGLSLLMLSFLPAACALEGAGDDATGGTGGVGNVAGTTGGGSGAGSGGAGGSGGTGGSAGASAGSGGTTGGSGGAGGTFGGAGSGGTSGTGPAAGVGGAGGAGAGGVAGGAGLSGAAGAGTGGDAGGGMGGGNAGGGAGGGDAAGASGKGGSGGTGGSSGYNPCPATGPCKILPLGDSITDGIGFSGGYRVRLFELALEDDKEITFVGGSMNGPQMVDGQPFPRAHEGHSGWTIAQIDGIVPDPALNVAPHIVLLHIGTNDMYQGPNGAPDRLGTLIDQILMDLPDALLVVSNIIPFPGQAGAVDTYNDAVPNVVNMRKEAGKHILFVDQFTDFPTSELGDGVHPNQAGYNRMAAKWYEAISSYLR